jgi:hypothetical protein|tara:strand:+ start:156 stop:461 length:306 start_codon:yes stop_codon:yes gene_type:complete
VEEKTQETNYKDKEKLKNKRIRQLFFILFLFMCAAFLLVLFIGYAFELYFKEAPEASDQQIYSAALKESDPFGGKRNTSLEGPAMGNDETGSGDDGGSKKS